MNCPYVTNIGDKLDKRVRLDKTVLDFFRSYVKENPLNVGERSHLLFPEGQVVEFALYKL